MFHFQFVLLQQDKLNLVGHSISIKYKAVYVYD